MEILKYKDYIMESKIFVNDENIIKVDTDSISEYIGISPSFSELVLDKDPENEKSDWNFEISIGYDGTTSEKILEKIEKLKIKFAQYIRDIILDIKERVLMIKFQKNLKIELV